ncbi:MAG: hypothetical protein AB1486_22140 [Planctomycetota bacterium]
MLLVNSVGPVIIDGSGVSADLITFGSDGQSTDSFGGLKNLWVYDAPNAGVYVNAAANKDVSPAFSGLRFNRCLLGLEIVSKYAAGTASPSMQSCYFHNSTDAWDATGPSNLRAHISIIASDATRTASPSITNCTFESQYPGRVTDGIYILAENEGVASPTINLSSIGYLSGPIPVSGTYGIGTGLRARARGQSGPETQTPGGTTNFVLQQSLVRGCYKNGVEISSDWVQSPTVSATIATPLIERCAIVGNGRSSTPPTSETRGSNPPSSGHGIFVLAFEWGGLAPTIRQNSPEYASGEITGNVQDGIHVCAASLLWPEAGVATFTTVEADIQHNRVYSNGRYGIYNAGDVGTAESTIRYNRIAHNTWGGVVNIAEGTASFDPDVGTAMVTATLRNNTIFGDAPYGASQRVGVLNDRYGGSGPGSGWHSAQAILTEVHDTVAQNYVYGIDNQDYHGGPIANPGSSVLNTISWYTYHWYKPGSRDISVGWDVTQVSHCDYYESTGANYNRKDLPRFVNLAGYDFHLKLISYTYGNYSKLIDKGRNVPVPPGPSPGYDFDGQYRRVQKPNITNAPQGWQDMGADEVQ